jgi:CheY-like chemotaxis protein
MEASAETSEKERDRYVTLQPSNILLVTDSVDEAFLLGKALRNASVDAYLHFARSEQETMAYLGSCIPDGMPRLVLVNTRLSGWNGLDILSSIRSRPATRDLRVYLLGNSACELEIARACREVANGYWLKPVNQGEHEQLAKMIKERLGFRVGWPKSVEADGGTLAASGPLALYSFRMNLLGLPRSTSP